MNSFELIGADRIPSVVHVLMGTKTCGGKKMWPFIILYMVHKPRYLQRVARVGKSRIENKDS